MRLSFIEYFRTSILYELLLLNLSHDWLFVIAPKVVLKAHGSTMTLLDQSHLKHINAVVEDLSHSECRKVVYLCGSLEADCSVESVKRMLKSNVEDHGDPALFLKALILRLERYDLLRKLYKVGRNDVEQQSQSYANVFQTFR